MYKVMWCHKDSNKIMSQKLPNLAAVVTLLDGFSSDVIVLHVFPYEDYNNKRCVKC